MDTSTSRTDSRRSRARAARTEPAEGRMPVEITHGTWQRSEHHDANRRLTLLADLLFTDLSDQPSQESAG